MKNRWVLWLKNCSLFHRNCHKRNLGLRTPCIFSFNFCTSVSSSPRLSFVLYFAFKALLIWLGGLNLTVEKERVDKMTIKSYSLEFSYLGESLLRENNLEIICLPQLDGWAAVLNSFNRTSRFMTTSQNENALFLQFDRL